MKTSLHPFPRDRKEQQKRAHKRSTNTNVSKRQKYNTQQKQKILLIRPEANQNPFFMSTLTVTLQIFSFLLSVGIILYAETFLAWQKNLFEL